MEGIDKWSISIPLKCYSHPFLRQLFPLTATLIVLLIERWLESRTHTISINKAGILIDGSVMNDTIIRFIIMF